MQNRPDSGIEKKFQHFSKRIDLQTHSNFSVIQNMAVFLKEIAINALKSGEI